jgi:hypothetical protein
VRQASRHGERANIRQRVNPVHLQFRDEFVECARGMADGLDIGQSALLYRYHVVIGIARDQLAHGIDTCFNR